MQKCKVLPSASVRCLVNCSPLQTADPDPSRALLSSCWAQTSNRRSLTFLEKHNSIDCIYLIGVELFKIVYIIHVMSNMTQP